MEGKSSFIVLLLIVAILSLALAVSIGLFFFSSGNDPKQPDPGPDEYPVITPLKDSDWDIKMLYGENEKVTLSLKGIDSKLAAYIQLQVEIKFSTKEAKTFEEKYAKYEGAIKAEISKYFSAMTYAEAQDQEKASEKANKHLTDKLNELLLQSPDSDKNKQLIYGVEFSFWFPMRDA